MSGRPKRRATAPKKFSIEEGMSQSAIKPVPRCSCGVSGYTLPDSPVRGQQQRVLRYLNVDDLNRTLQDLTVSKAGVVDREVCLFVLGLCIVARRWTVVRSHYSQSEISVSIALH